MQEDWWMWPPIESSGGDNAKLTSFDPCYLCFKQHTTFYARYKPFTFFIPITLLYSAAAASSEKYGLFKRHFDIDSLMMTF